MLNISKRALENLFLLLSNRISEVPALFSNWFTGSLVLGGLAITGLWNWQGF